MKKLLLAALVLSLSVAQVTRADSDKERKKHKRQADSAAEARPQQSGQRQAAAKPAQQQGQRKVQPTQRNTSHAPRSLASSQRQAVQSEAQLEGRNRNRVQPSNQGGSQNANVNRNLGNAQVSTQGIRGNRNFNRNSFTVARANVVRTPHNRNWWHSHYNTTFVLFGGGYYYWWNNYWYPAFGFSPYYNNYIYSEPIYGYDNLDPGQVIENVQLALRDEGYYPGAIDGLMGPQTRAALGACQRDRGLVVTEAVDEPTLVTLGLA